MVEAAPGSCATIYYLPHRSCSCTWKACLLEVAARGLTTPFGLVCERVAAAAPLALTPSLDLSKAPRFGASASALTPFSAAANICTCGDAR